MKRKLTMQQANDLAKRASEVLIFTFYVVQDDERGHRVVPDINMKTLDYDKVLSYYLHGERMRGDE